MQRRDRRKRRRPSVATLIMIVITLAVMIVIARFLPSGFIGAFVPAFVDQIMQQELPSGNSSSAKPSQNAQITTAPITPEPSPTPFTGTRSLTFRAVGDCMAHDGQLSAALDKETGEYDFMSVYEYIGGHLSEGDFTIANLETVIAGEGKKGYTGYPMFNTPDSYLTALKSAGVDVLTLANNHILDRYVDGAHATVTATIKHGFAIAGASRTQEEYDTPLILEKEGMRVAVLSYTFGTNGMESHSDQTMVPFTVHYIDKDAILKDIQTVRSLDVDAVIVSLHMGQEYKRQPESQTKKLMQALCEGGADVILGSHPHMLQPVEKTTVTRADGKEYEALILYSMGNFISDQREQYKDTGAIFGFTLEKDYQTNMLSIKSTTYLPTWVWRFDKDGKRQYRILPIEETLDNLPEGMSSKDQKRLKAAGKEAKELIGQTAMTLR